MITKLLILDARSFLFDRKLGMFITLNGQLLLLKWMEMVSECGNIIQANTDGIEVQIEIGKEQRYFDLCKEWEDMTGLELEHDYYTKLVSADINNYISINRKGEAKCKGRFEFEPFLKFDTNVLHKNRSQLIVPIAIHAFFTKGIPIETTILNHMNIFDFCLGDRSKGTAWFESLDISSGGLRKEKLPKTIRYYISREGTVFKKYMPDKDKDKINESYLVVHPQRGRQYKMKLFNKIEHRPMADYGIDYSYYIKEARKEIDAFQLNQTSLL